MDSLRLFIKVEEGYVELVHAGRDKSIPLWVKVSQLFAEKYVKSLPRLLPEC